MKIEANKSQPTFRALRVVLLRMYEADKSCSETDSLAAPGGLVGTRSSWRADSTSSPQSWQSLIAHEQFAHPPSPPLELWRGVQPLPCTLQILGYDKGLSADCVAQQTLRNHSPIGIYMGPCPHLLRSQCKLRLLRSRFLRRSRSSAARVSTIHAVHLNATADTYKPGEDNRWQREANEGRELHFTQDCSNDTDAVADHHSLSTWLVHEGSQLSLQYRLSHTTT